MNKSIFTGIEEFIELRRSFGFKFERGGYVLREFAAFLKKIKKKTITTAMVLEWLESHYGSSPESLSVRFQIVRAFAAHWKAYDRRTEVPGRNISYHPPKRARPHIYTPVESRKILLACGTLSRRAGSRTKLHSPAFFTLLGLMMATGLRRRETVNLRRHHIDLEKGTLLVELTKFRKSRLIPLHSSTVTKLAEYAAIRDRIVKKPTTDHFFLGDQGRAVSNDMIYYRFVRICRAAGLREHVVGRGGPRLHDLRHTFAVRVILRWLRQGKNIHEMMPILSTYLGHDHPSDTYWYLTGVPELLKFGLHKDQR